MNCPAEINWPQAAVFIAEWLVLGWIFGGSLVTINKSLAKNKDDKE